jgi:hypothetical protein
MVCLGRIPDMADRQVPPVLDRLAAPSQEPRDTRLRLALPPLHGRRRAGLAVSPRWVEAVAVAKTT